MTNTEAPSIDLDRIEGAAEKAQKYFPRTRHDTQDYAEVTQTGAFQAMVSTEADADLLMLTDARTVLALVAAVKAARVVAAAWEWEPGVAKPIDDLLAALQPFTVTK